MIRPPLTIVVLVCALVFGFAGLANAATITHVIDHQLLVNQPAQSYEHRFDLPEADEMAGRFFVKRHLKMEGKMVIEREEFTPTYYFVKVRLPKVIGEFKRGILTISLETGSCNGSTPVLDPPTELTLFPHAAALKPVFVWKGKGYFCAVTLFDLDEGKTVFERVTTIPGHCAYDEDWLKMHHYKWAVKQSDETGRYSKEVQAGFRIEKQNGVVVAVPE